MTYFTNVISYKTVRDLRRDVFCKFNDVPLSYIDTHSHGDLISRVINDVDAVGDGLSQMFCSCSRVLLQFSEQWYLCL